MGRFINADNYPSTGQGLTGNNMFAYCGNNPVSRADNSGELWHVAFGAALGAVLSGGFKLIECINNGDSIGKTVSKVLVSTVCGAAGGALAATGIGVVGQTIIGGVLGAAESAASQMIDSGSIDSQKLIVDTAAGMLGGAVGGKGASHGSKFMSYHRNEFLKNVTTEGVDVALSKFWKHTWKWAKSNLLQSTMEGVSKAFLGSRVAECKRNVAINIYDRIAGAVS